MDIVYRAIRSSEEFHAARAIVRAQYEQSGYATSTGGALEDKMSLYLANEATKTFVALCDDVVFATLSLVPDSSRGLPLDELYQEEMDILRKQGGKLAEVSQLALDKQLVEKLYPTENKQKRMTLVLPLFKLILHFGLREKIDTLCITINPKHDPFYSSLGFRTFGELKYYASFNQAPALAKSLDLKNQEALKGSFLYRELFLSPPDPSSF